MPTVQQASDTLRSTFGFKTFREGQAAVVERLLDGKSVLAIFPTGAGKSLCYQLPALLLDGVTLVISPLIALMKDQIDFLRSHGVAAGRLDSSLGPEETREVFTQIRKGHLKILYIAPERLANERFLQTLRQMKISMLAVDEAHCISEWGHNFRPDYLKLAALARDLNVGRVLALTATATPMVAQQIAKAFTIAAEDVVQTGFYRPNLNLHGIPCESGKRSIILLNRLLSRPRGPTIVYVTLQKTAEEVAQFLNDNGMSANCYHAGLDADKRHAVQDHFMASTDAVVVATIAFGMGIDKSDIRYVFHYNLPKTLENYAQEIGRAGRDGQLSYCEMLASMDDVTVLENFTFGDTPTAEAVDSLVRDVLGRGEIFDLSAYDLSFTHDIRPIVVETVLTYLQVMGILKGTGPFYTEYKFQPLVSGQQMLEKFDEHRAAFLKKIFQHAKQGKTWRTLRIIDAVEATGEPRDRIVSALNYLEEQGDLTLQVSGLRHGYLLTRAPDDLAAVSSKLAARFLEREDRDAQRIQEVIRFAESSSCRTRRLMEYFGQSMDKDCGHCDRCEGQPLGRIPVTHRHALADRETQTIKKLRNERRTSLRTPRQITRFLCGITSPQTSRERLGRHPLFGTLSGRPFREVLEFVEASA